MKFYPLSLEVDQKNEILLSIEDGLRNNNIQDILKMVEKELDYHKFEHGRLPDEIVVLDPITFTNHLDDPELEPSKELMLLQHG